MKKPKKIRVVRLGFLEPLNETKIAKVISTDCNSINGILIYPLGLAGQTITWLSGYFSEVSEKDYRPLIKK